MPGQTGDQLGYRRQTAAQHDDVRVENVHDVGDAASHSFEIVRKRARRLLIALVHRGEGQAGVDPGAVHQHRAGAALAVVAALLGAGQPQVMAQRVQQRSARIDVEAVGRAVRTSLILSAFVLVMISLAVYGQSGNFNLAG